MFFALRWVVRSVVWLGVAALLLVAWQYRALFDPVVDYYRAWQIGRGEHRPEPLQLTGVVVRVFDGESLQFREPRGMLWNVRLAGIEAPDLLSGDREEKLRAERSRTHLSQLVLSNQVRLEVTLTNPARSALAVAHRGPSNICAAQIVSRHAVLRRDYMAGLTLQTRFQLLQAQRQVQAAPASPGW